ncbi:MAG: amidinotransferase family protein [Eubacterium sp.]|nr:amidinotransferase family protein [Eubacterium sp.]
MFTLPEYIIPDFSTAVFEAAPDVKTLPATGDGLLPDNFYATTIYPEYFKINKNWKLINAPRMDCVVVIRDGLPYATEARRVKKGDEVVIGREEDLSNGVFINYDAFKDTKSGKVQNFAFRTGKSRESSYSRDYDQLYDILRHDRDHGSIVWVLGPAVAFDYDARRSMSGLIENGYVDALFAGNALATHDLEAGLFHTGLGQDIYTKELYYNGHYHHLETINRVRCAGSIENYVTQNNLSDGIAASCVRKNVPLVLAGSIRDDGPLPGVIGNVYEAQDAMRQHIMKATTVIALATQLHTIATGNMTPSWQISEGKLRPVYFYTVDISEFAVGKLHDRGSLSVNSIVTNVQDFLINAARSLGVL